MRNVGIAVTIGAAVVLLILLGVVGAVMGWFGEVADEVLDPREAVARWQWFYDTHQALEAQESNVLQAELSVANFIELYGDDTSTWGWQAQEEYQRLVTVRDGYIINYNRVAEEYNAKMMDITRNYAAPPDLPEYIKPWPVG